MSQFAAMQPPAASQPGGKPSSSFSQLPRAVRWALVFGVFVLAYFLAIEPAIDQMNKWNAQSDVLTEALKNYGKQEAELRAASDAIKLGQRQFGEVALPGDPRTRPDEFRDAISRILDARGVDQRTISARSGSFTQGPLVDHVKGVSRVEKQIADVSFLSTPETFAAVLADLEREKFVTSVRRAQVRQSEGKEKVDRLLRVSLELETWTMSKVEKAK
ncbi:MAG: hypothetical protein ACK5ZG_11100 [Phycisphaerae bacterium]